MDSVFCVIATNCHPFSWVADSEKGSTKIVLVRSTNQQETLGFFFFKTEIRHRYFACCLDWVNRVYLMSNSIFHEFRSKGQLGRPYLAKEDQAIYMLGKKFSN